MNDIPESEALALLQLPKFCKDLREWEVVKGQPDTVGIGIGILDAEGLSMRMYAELHYHRGAKTRIASYKFSVFRRTRLAIERVYQLQVNIFPKPVRDKHQLSHEHIGDARYPGDASWATWSYDEVIEHFCRRTNLKFDVRPLHPEDFRLQG